MISEKSFVDPDIVEAIRETHTKMFHGEHDLVFGTPLHVRFNTEPEDRISGLTDFQAVYLARRSSLAYFLLQVFRPRFRRGRGSISRIVQRNVSTEQSAATVRDA